MYRSIVLAAALVAATGCDSDTLVVEDRSTDTGNGGTGGSGTGGTGGIGEGGTGGESAGGTGGTGEGGTGGTGGEACVPRTCASEEATCGTIDDGCGHEVECGSCEAPETCGGAGLANRCGCTDETDHQLCQRVGATCGAIEAADACGSVRTVADCGTCTDDLVCAGDGTPNTCTTGPLWTREHPAASEDLLAVWSFGANDAWAVGRNGTTAQHDGNSLAAVPSGTHSDLVDVWASSRSDLWAVGGRGTLLRMDGRFWRQVVTGFDADFISVAGFGPDDVWVLARSGTDTFFVHGGGGGAWTRVNPPLLGDETLSRIRAIDGQLWAAGSGGLVLRWNGQTWERELTNASTDLFALGGVGGQVWAAGGIDVYRYDGTGWSPVPADASWQPSHAAVDLWGDAATGTPWLLLGGSSADQVFRTNGADSSWTRWTGLPLPFAGSNAIHGSGTGDAWVVGDAGRVANYNGTAFDRVSAVPPSCTNVVTAGLSAWALCGTTIFERSASGRWSELPRPPALTSRITSIWAGGANDLWALTYYGSSMYSATHHWDGSAWTNVKNWYNRIYTGIAVTTSHVLLIGPGGRLTIDQAEYYAFTGHDPTAIAAFGDKAWVIGTSGLVSYVEGTGWHNQTLSRTLNAVSAFDASNVFAVGNGGAVVKWDGSSWLTTGFDIPADVASDRNLTSVWVESPTSVWAVAGGSGNLFHWDGTAWTLADPLERPPGLQAVASLSSGELIGVGSGMARRRP